MIHDNLISASEAAKILGITPTRIGFLCRHNRFEGAEKVGAVWIIPREAVLNHKRLPPGSKPRTPKCEEIEAIRNETLQKIKTGDDNDQ